MWVKGTFTPGYPTGQTPFVEEIVLSPTELSWHLCQSRLTITVEVYTWTLGSVPKIYMSSFMPVPHHLDYCSHVWSFEIDKYKSSLFFRKIGLAILSPLGFHMNLIPYFLLSPIENDFGCIHLVCYPIHERFLGNRTLSWSSALTHTPREDPGVCYLAKWRSLWEMKKRPAQVYRIKSQIFHPGFLFHMLKWGTLLPPSVFLLCFELRCCCSIAKSCLTLCDPMDCTCQSPLFSTISWSLLKFMCIGLVMLSNYLIPCHPLLLLPSIFRSNRVFPNESVLHIRWPKYWSFSFSNRPSNDIQGRFPLGLTGLISLQGTLKTLLQHHNLKALCYLLYTVASAWGWFIHSFIHHMSSISSMPGMHLLFQGNNKKSKHKFWWSH